MHVCFCCVCFSFSVLSQEIGWEECHRNDRFCVRWDVKPINTNRRTPHILAPNFITFRILFMNFVLSALCSLARAVAKAANPLDLTFSLRRQRIGAVFTRLMFSQSLNMHWGYDFLKLCFPDIACDKLLPIHYVLLEVIFIGLCKHLPHPTSFHF